MEGGSGHHVVGRIAGFGLLIRAGDGACSRSLAWVGRRGEGEEKGDIEEKDGEKDG